MNRFLQFVGLAAVVAVAAVVLINVLPEDNGPPATPPPTQATQPSPAGTPGTPPPAAVRRLRLDGWSFDASSITVSYTNTGDTFTFGTAQCRVEFGAAGVMWPQLPLRGLDPGASWTETHRDLWAAGNVPTLVPECVIVDP